MLRKKFQIAGAATENDRQKLLQISSSNFAHFLMHTVRTFPANFIKFLVVTLELFFELTCPIHNTFMHQLKNTSARWATSRHVYIWTKFWVVTIGFIKRTKSGGGSWKTLKFILPLQWVAPTDCNGHVKSWNVDLFYFWNVDTRFKTKK